MHQYIFVHSNIYKCTFRKVNNHSKQLKKSRVFGLHRPDETATETTDKLQFPHNVLVEYANAYPRNTRPEHKVPYQQVTMRRTLFETAPGRPATADSALR